MTQDQYLAIIEAIAVIGGILGAMWAVVLFMLYDIKRMIGGRKVKKERVKGGDDDEIESPSGDSR
ncbi:MAG: hypothetical protein AUF65_02375 [Chloroflexi bacterium 13_1_20CM_50_12]|nr:MAG: hypothetical protein AUF65_02375 [Chloroflexi bacterium 13_1_20CM_50_12]